MSTPPDRPRLFYGVVDCHQTTQHPVGRDRSKTASFHDAREHLGARVVSKRSGNVAVGVGIAVESPTQGGSDRPQVPEIRASNDWIGWTAEIKRQRLPS